MIAASENDSTRFVELLLEYDDLDPNLEDQRGETALVKAAQKRRLDVVRLLLARGVAVNAADNRGFTALHAAIHEEDQFHDLRVVFRRTVDEWKRRNCEIKDEIVRLLLSSGADVNARDFRGNTPLDLTRRFEAVTGENTIERLRRCCSNDCRSIERLGRHLSFQSNNGEDVDADSRGTTPLHWLIIHGLRLFILHESQYHRNVPFRHSRGDVMGILKEIARTISPDSQDHRGRTALHYFFMHKDLLLTLRWKHLDDIYAKWLLDERLGCGLEVQDAYGKMPLHYASESSILERIATSIDSPPLRNNDGMTAKELSELRKKFKEAQRKYSKFKEQERMGDEETDLKDDYEEILREENVYGYRGALNLRIGLKSFVHPSDGKLNSEGSVTWKCWKEGQYASRNPITNGLCEHLQKFINRLADEIGKRDAKFECKPTFAGSSYEGTKIDLPVEYDFDLILTRISKFCEVVPSADAPKGFVHLKRKSGIGIHQKDSESFFNTDGYLLTTKISARFQSIIVGILKKKSFWTDEPLFDLEFSNEYNYGYGTHTKSLCFTLKLTLNGPVDGEYIFEPISVDIVPCIHIDGWWPDGAISNIGNDILTDGCNLVFDQPQRKYPVDCVFATVRQDFIRAGGE